MVFGPKTPSFSNFGLLILGLAVGTCSRGFGAKSLMFPDLMFVLVGCRVLLKIAVPQDYIRIYRDVQGWTGRIGHWDDKTF